MTALPRRPAWPARSPARCAASNATRPPLQAFSKNGVAYAEGETIKLPDLARTLERIEKQGRDGFYKGETARLLAEEMMRGGGIITEEDLAALPGEGARTHTRHLPRLRRHQHAAAQQRRRRADRDAQHPRGLRPARARPQLVATRALHGRGDAPARSSTAPASLADPDFAARARRAADSARRTRSSCAPRINPAKATPSAPADVTAGAAKACETTHYSVVDENGMAVSVTYTLEAGYGSGIVVPGAGFLLNNEMGDFNARPGLTTRRGLIGTEPNLARPEQRMLSSMTPTIIAKDGKLVAIDRQPGRPHHHQHRAAGRVRTSSTSA